MILALVRASPALGGYMAALATFTALLLPRAWGVVEPRGIDGRDGKESDTEFSDEDDEEDEGKYQDEDKDGQDEDGDGDSSESDAEPPACLHTGTTVERAFF